MTEERKDPKTRPRAQTMGTELVERTMRQRVRRVPTIIVEEGGMEEKDILGTDGKVYRPVEFETPEQSPPRPPLPPVIGVVVPATSAPEPLHDHETPRVAVRRLSRTSRRGEKYLLLAMATAMIIGFGIGLTILYLR